MNDQSDEQSDEQERQAVVGMFHRLLYPEQYEAETLRAELARTREVLRALLQRVERGTCAGSHGPDGGWPERLAAVELLKEGP